jgi:tetratricopeptide (TPR) repeat protein
MADDTTTLKGTDYAYNLGLFERRVTTNSPEAQVWFNRGLIWGYAFNHNEASTCFERAIAHDESFAMAYWGLAWTSGPNYNQPWEAFGPNLENVVQRTYRASRKAMALVDGTTPVERALITAIQARYQSDKPAPMEQYKIQNQAFSDAMEVVYRDFGDDDLDVATLYADSLVTLTPWKLWDLVTGEPIPGTRSIDAKKVLEKALKHKGAKGHPGLLHTYIHLIEMSSTPELGLSPSDHLRYLVPDSGHLCHMPSHLDVLVGDYRAAIQSSQLATRADEKFMQQHGVMNFYTVYRMHNYHTLIYAAMFAGQKAVALDGTDRMENSLPKEVLTTLGMADYAEVFISVRWHVMVRFGMWQEIIERALPDDPVVYSVTTAMALYAKGVAYAATGRVPEAETHRALFIEAAKRIPDTRLDFPNKCIDIVPVASAMLDGEIEYRRGNYTEAFAHLRRSVELDDGLEYSEPWNWMQPARHALAALLLEQNQVEEAAAVYRADLGLDNSVIRARQHLNNVWALQGYHECLVRLGREDEARSIWPQLKVAVALADVPVTSSCFCRTDTESAPKVSGSCSKGGCNL